MKEKIQTLLTGGAGFGGVEFLQAHATDIVQKVGEASNILIQLAIGIGTLVALFRKKKKDKASL